MMKRIAFSFAVFCIISCHKNLDKTLYEARVGSSCAKTSSGGYMIYDSCRLIFNQNKVKIQYYQVDTDNPQIMRENKIEYHRYTFNRNIIDIDSFQYGRLFYKKDLLFTLYRIESTDTLKFFKK